MCAAQAFLARLLELRPVCSETGRQIARLAVPSAGPSAADLAAVACGRWLVGAIPGGAVRQIAAHVDRGSLPALVDFYTTSQRLPDRWMTPV